MKDNQRVVLTKHMLKSALFRIVSAKHISNVTVSELCAEAGINRSTFYRHYEYPKDVLLEVLSDFFANIIKKFETVEPMDMEKYMELFFDFVKEHADLARVFIECTDADDFRNTFVSMYRGALRKNGLSNAIDAYEENQRHLIYTFIAGGTYNFLRQWLLSEMDMSSTELAELVIKVFNCELLPLR